MNSKTKIIATVGPASEGNQVLKSIFKSGADLVRLNTKHNTLDWHSKTINRFQQAEKQVNRNMGLIIDLSKPKLTKELNQFIKSYSGSIDYLALSFVRNKNEVKRIRDKIREINEKIGLISKIESPQGLKNIDQIIEASDGIMIARGDLAIEAGFEKLPGIQKRLILKCRRKGKPVIVATEMLESMINSKTPTRAEIIDVANAVYGGTDGVMLSGETAIGQYPVEAVKMMNKTIEAVEEEGADIPHLFRNERFPLNDESIVRLANKITDFIEKDDQPAGYLVFTKSGQTAFSLSSFRPDLPIFAFTDNPTVMGKLLLGYGIDSFNIGFDDQRGVIDTIKLAIETLKKKKEVNKGDKLIIVSGDNIGVKGGTNNIRITEVS